MNSDLLSGHMITGDGPVRINILVEGGRISQVSGDEIEPGPETARYEGIILQSLADMHTHMGDNLARGDLPPNLSDVVLPGGMKHEFLERTPRSQLTRSMRSSLDELGPGVSFTLDYRESGSKGLEVLNEALSFSDPMVFPLTRVVPGDDPKDLLERSAGFGIPSLSGDLDHLREITGKAGKIFSIHASETYREDAEALISLQPDQVVHMISGTISDWRMLAELKIPVAVCPRSNAAYGMRVPLKEMVAEGLILNLGTDNAISSRQDMFREMEHAWYLLRTSGITGENAARKIFEMASGWNLKETSLGRMITEYGIDISGEPPGIGQLANLSVIRYPASEKWLDAPFSHIVRFASRSDVLYTGRPRYMA
jgi:cytosine/adenosine deaminase-related metal-dependent hydrolase